MASKKLKPTITKELIMMPNSEYKARFMDLHEQVMRQMNLIAHVIRKDENLILVHELNVLISQIASYYLALISRLDAYELSYDDLKRLPSQKIAERLLKKIRQNRSFRITRSKRRSIPSSGLRKIILPGQSISKPVTGDTQQYKGKSIDSNLNPIVIMDWIADTNLSLTKSDPLDDICDAVCNINSNEIDPSVISPINRLGLEEESPAPIEILPVFDDPDAIWEDTCEKQTINFDPEDFSSNRRLTKTKRQKRRVYLSDSDADMDIPYYRDGDDSDIDGNYAPDWYLNDEDSDQEFRPVVPDRRKRQYRSLEVRRRKRSRNQSIQGSVGKNAEKRLRHNQEHRNFVMVELQSYDQPATYTEDERLQLLKWMESGRIDQDFNLKPDERSDLKQFYVKYLKSKTRSWLYKYARAKYGITTNEDREFYLEALKTLGLQDDAKYSHNLQITCGFRKKKHLKPRKKIVSCFDPSKYESALKELDILIASSAEQESEYLRTWIQSRDPFEKGVRVEKSRLSGSKESSDLNKSQEQSLPAEETAQTNDLKVDTGPSDKVQNQSATSLDNTLTKPSENIPCLYYLTYAQYEDLRSYVEKYLNTKSIEWIHKWADAKYGVSIGSLRSVLRDLKSPSEKNVKHDENENRYYHLLVKDLEKYDIPDKDNIVVWLNTNPIQPNEFFKKSKKSLTSTASLTPDQVSDLQAFYAKYYGMLRLLMIYRCAQAKYFIASSLFDEYTESIRSQLYNIPSYNDMQIESSIQKLNSLPASDEVLAVLEWMQNGLKRTTLSLTNEQKDDITSFYKKIGSFQSYLWIKPYIRTKYDISKDQMNLLVKDIKLERPIGADAEDGSKPTRAPKEKKENLPLDDEEVKSWINCGKHKSTNKNDTEKLDPRQRQDVGKFYATYIARGYKGDSIVAAIVLKYGISTNMAKKIARKYAIENDFDEPNKNDEHIIAYWLEEAVKFTDDELQVLASGDSKKKGLLQSQKNDIKNFMLRLTGRYPCDWIGKYVQTKYPKTPSTEIKKIFKDARQEKKKEEANKTLEKYWSKKKKETSGSDGIHPEVAEEWIESGSKPEDGKLREEHYRDMYRFYKRHITKHSIDDIWPHVFAKYGVKKRALEGLVQRAESGEPLMKEMKCHAVNSFKNKKVTPEMIEEVRKMVKANLCITVKELSEKFNLHLSTMNKLLKENNITLLSRQQRKAVLEAIGSKDTNDASTVADDEEDEEDEEDDEDYEEEAEAAVASISGHASSRLVPINHSDDDSSVLLTFNDETDGILDEIHHRSYTSPTMYESPFHQAPNSKLGKLVKCGPKGRGRPRKNPKDILAHVVSHMDIDPPSSNRHEKAQRQKHQDKRVEPVVIQRTTTGMLYSRGGRRATVTHHRPSTEEQDTNCSADSGMDNRVNSNTVHQPRQNSYQPHMQQQMQQGRTSPTSFNILNSLSNYTTPAVNNLPATNSSLFNQYTLNADSNTNTAMNAPIIHGNIGIGHGAGVVIQSKAQDLSVQSNANSNSNNLAYQLYIPVTSSTGVSGSNAWTQWANWNTMNVMAQNNLATQNQVPANRSGNNFQQQQQQLQHHLQSQLQSQLHNQQATHQIATRYNQYR